MINFFKSLFENGIKLTFIFIKGNNNTIRKG